MRVVVLQDFLRAGGTERQSVCLCRDFASAGTNATLITLRPGGRLESLAREHQVENLALTKVDLKLNFLALGLSRCLAEQRPDVVLCMGRVANAYAGHLQRKLPGVAVVGSLRTGKRIPWLNLRNFRQLPAIVVNTNWWRTALVDLGLEERRIHVIPNGLGFDWDLDALESSRMAIRARLGTFTNEVVLVNVAGFRPGKRHEELLRILVDLPQDLNWRLWLVGDGPRHQAARKLARTLGLESRVHFAGHVADPFAYLAGADVAVSVSVEDALPNFLVEAQTLGLPVVARSFRGVGGGDRARAHGLYDAARRPRPVPQSTRHTRTRTRDARRNGSPGS